MRIKELALVFGSLLLALLLCEGGLRIFTRYGAHDRGPASSAGKPLSLAEAERYFNGIPLAPGVDRSWFQESPPPLVNRTSPNPALAARYRDFERRGIFGSQSEYIWNSYLVKRDRCNPTGLFRNYPETLLAFTPDTPSLHPRYRFPTNQSLLSGLVTNRFGLRGHPIDLEKPARTIRIAFLGASTTVSNHDFAFSYPEFVENWLNRYAGANRLDVRFEVLNGGREGINSHDVKAILRDELLPLDPDLAVYYEGANQFVSANLLVTPTIPPRLALDPHDPIVHHRLPEILRTHLALGDLADRVLNGFRTVGEPRKPDYRLAWPKNVSEDNPDPDSRDLPLQLPGIVADLDAIRTSLRTTGGRLALCSFEWFTPGNTTLSPVRHKFIYEQLNTSLWPLRYDDIRRLNDFQNRVFRKYAGAREIPFLDVASQIPEDPNLFIDAIHMTQVGERLKAWIAFQKLISVIRPLIDSGKLPHHTGPAALPKPPSLQPGEMSTACPVPVLPVGRIEGAIALDRFEKADDSIPVKTGRPMVITTHAGEWSNAVSFPLHITATGPGDLYLLIRARVVEGRIGLGVSDSETKDNQVEKFVDVSPAVADIYLPVPYAPTANYLIVRNVARGGVVSKIEIEDLALVSAASH